MDPQLVFCPNSACSASGRVGGGNIWIHSRSPLRYGCTRCGKTFSHRRGTPFYLIHTQAQTITLAINLVAHWQSHGLPY
jgi:transposase-like protein